MLKLIDSLVKPVAMYSCQIWLPATAIIKEIIKPDCTNVPQYAAKDAFEITHLRMLKWVLGVHRKTSNNFCYGDSDRYPWALTVLPQCLRYFQRVSQAPEGPKCVSTLIHHAFQEQKNMNLSWFEAWNEVSRQQHQPPTQSSPVEGYHDHMFISQWQSSLLRQSKMEFYRKVKLSFGEEDYLGLQNSAFRAQIAKMRSSSHDLRVETGRYVGNHHDPTKKLCRYCCDNNDGTMTAFVNLPFCEDLILETEEHALTECPAYHHLRSALSENIKSLLMLKEYRVIMSTHHMNEFGRYLVDCHRLRNPKDSDNHRDN